MKNIKFRAWDKKSKKLHYDITGFEFGVEEMTGVFIDGDFYDKENIELMQYTGLKDKNGKEIYEGDILKIPEWLMQDNQDKCICIYAEEHQTIEIIGFGLYIKDEYSGEYKIIVPSDEWDEFEVIGNIYDNPELLEKEG